MSNMFAGCEALDSLDLSGFNTANVTDMSGMFNGCSGLEILNMTGWNTENVTTMNSLFAGCAALTNLDLSGFNTANVTDMAEIFNNCSALEALDLNSFNTANVTDMSGMFAGCTGLTALDLRHFNTANVTDMGAMFAGCTGLTALDLRHFNTANVTDMGDMFNGCESLATIYVGHDWNTASVQLSENMFLNCTSLVGGNGTPYDSNCLDVTYARVDGGQDNPGYLSELIETYALYTPDNTTLTFYRDDLKDTREGVAYDLNEADDYPGWYNDGTSSSITHVEFDASFADARPTTMYGWFAATGLQSFTASSNLNTDSVRNMAHLFSDCEALTKLDLTELNTAMDTTMQSMFSGCVALTTIYVDTLWNTDSVKHSEDMFLNCTSLVGGQGTAYDAECVDVTYARIDGGTEAPGYFSEKPAIVRGDVNGDGAVNIADVTNLIDYLLGGTRMSPAAADCNQDGQVNIGDVTHLIDYLLSGNW